MVQLSMTLIDSWLEFQGCDIFFNIEYLRNDTRKSTEGHMLSIEWWHFQWPWRSCNQVFKVTAFLMSNVSKWCVLRTNLLQHTNRKPTIPNIWNGTMFGDLDWLLNASRGLSAIAEFLVLLCYNCGGSYCEFSPSSRQYYFTIPWLYCKICVTTVVNSAVIAV